LRGPSGPCYSYVTANERSSMGTRITGGDREKYPEIEVSCLNTVAHIGYKIVNFKIPKGVSSKKCPQCGRKIGKDDA
jgi:hypothetical protein